MNNYNFDISVQFLFLFAQERIQGLNFVSPGMYTTKGYIRNNEMTMTASITKGSNVTFYWTVSCESKKNYTGNSTTKDWKFTPIELGKHLVLLT